MRPTYIIAEIGSCHDGQLSLMKEAVSIAASCGASACKFQWTSDPDLMARRRGRALEDGYAEIYRRYLAWPTEWHAGLAASCQKAGIDYMCSIYLPQDIAVVAPYVARFKAASFEARDVAFIEFHRPYASRLKPLIVSTGMCSWEDFAWAYDWGYDDLFLLHCVSAYPAPLAELNLQTLRMAYASNASYGGRDMGRRPRTCIDFQGFSDHSDPAETWTGALAVAAGAWIIESHLRLDETDPSNPDYSHAMNPAQFAEYVTHIRFAERCLGDGVKRVQLCEQPMVRYRVEGTT